MLFAWVVLPAHWWLCLGRRHHHLHPALRGSQAALKTIPSLKSQLPATRAQVYRCGFSKRLGPVALMDEETAFIGRRRTRAVANIGTEMAAIALAEIEEVHAPSECSCPCTLPFGAIPGPYLGLERSRKHHQQHQELHFVSCLCFQPVIVCVTWHACHRVSSTVLSSTVPSSLAQFRKLCCRRM